RGRGSSRARRGGGGASGAGRGGGATGRSARRDRAAGGSPESAGAQPGRPSERNADFDDHKGAARSESGGRSGGHRPNVLDRALARLPQGGVLRADGPARGGSSDRRIADVPPAWEWDPGPHRGGCRCVCSSRRAARTRRLATRRDRIRLVRGDVPALETPPGRLGRRREGLLHDAEDLLAPPLCHRDEAAELEPRQLDETGAANRPETEVGEKVRREDRLVHLEALVLRLPFAVPIREG